MISKLHLHNIGPAPDLEAEFGERLNIITGDNGLGKTFLLDACWYALTRTWADQRVFYPAPGVKKADPPHMEYSVIGKSGKEAGSGVEFDFSSQIWKGRQARPPMPGLVIYARIDGGFSVWDPARNYWRDGDEGAKRAAAYQFTKAEVWNGLPLDAVRPEDIICNGLLRDVENWRLKGNGVFDLLQNVLRTISAGEAETLQIGESVRVGLSASDIPTLVMPYGLVPVTHAASAVRRVLALAYLLVWAWEEHKRAAEQKQEEPTRRMVLLFDEVEAHLHPKWQRVFLPAILRVTETLLMQDSVESIQIIATTHAPLVLGSVETLWDQEKDQLFDLDLEGNEVELEAIDFAKHGSAENWLGSDSFDLPDDYPGYSVQAQKAMQRADAFMLQYPQAANTPIEEMETIDQALRQVLGGDDEYWPYWAPYRDHRRNVR
jgi:AAA domain, putative AbiEii toxin, Type IV TA system